MATTRLQQAAHRRAIEINRSIGETILRLREDAGLTLTAVAAAAGVDRRFLSRIERGERGASLETLTASLAVLGADLSLKAYPSTGPTIHDRVQGLMGEGLLPVVHRRWVPSLEVSVWRPARGVIDLVLDDAGAPIAVASELQSGLRRLEQQVRWHRMKEESLPSSELWRFIGRDGATATSRLLVLRSTRETRELADTFAETLRLAYPARCADVVEALTAADAAWPGAGIAWMRVDGGRAELLAGPPRGVRLGR